MSYARVILTNKIRVPESTQRSLHDRVPLARRISATPGARAEVTVATPEKKQNRVQDEDVKESFYVRVDAETYEPTELTRGPWDAYAQHAGPPAALLGHAIEAKGREGMRIARITFDILRPVPLSTLKVTATPRNQGRSTETIEAVLEANGRTVMRASALRIREESGVTPEHSEAARVDPPAGLEENQIPMRFDVGYHTAMETRNVEGAFNIPGPATVWFRMRHPLIDGEETQPIERVLIAADSGNGVSGVLNIREYLYINPELTVHLHRYPVSEWVCLEAKTMISGDGIGLADTVLHDESGPIGRGTQSLYVARQPAS